MHTRNTILVVVLVAIVGVVLVIKRSKPDQSNVFSEAVNVAKHTSIAKSMRYEQAKELAGIDGYLNTNGKEIKIADLVGSKVILVDFWTYSCINCQRTLPYLTSWYEKYKDQGLEIIGVHTPEFDFEKEADNVQAAIEKFGISYPVVQDNEYATWQAYKNRYWPRKYLIDIDGYIVYDHIGEGGYEETEKKIQGLLKERAETLKEAREISSDVVYPNTELDSPGQAGSPEIYFGAFRNERLGNGTRGAVGVQTFPVPDTIKTNTLYLVGEWDIQKEYAESVSDDARIIFRYNAQDVFAVASARESVVAPVTIDGQSVGSEGGADIGVGGLYLEHEERLYRIIENMKTDEHTLEITVPSGVQFYTFTFG